MSVNVQLANELRRISGGRGATLNQILTALGYTPASATDLASHTSDSIIHITAAERQQWNRSFSGSWNDLYNKPAIDASLEDRLVFADAQGNIIAQLDRDGLKTTEVFVGGTNIRDLIQASRGFSGNYSDLKGAPNIFEDNSGELVFTDSNNYIIARLDASGLNVAALSIGGVPLLDHLTINSAAIDYNLITNRPAIEQDEAAAFLITDVNGNIVARIDETGLNTVGLAISGKPVTTLINEARFSGNYLDLTNRPAIDDDGSGALQFVDTNGNIAAELNNAGLVVAALYVGKSAREFGGWVNEIQTTLTGHVNNTTSHITAAEREKWNTLSTPISSLQEAFTAHDDNTSRHVSVTERNAWVQITPHIIDTTVHITAAERAKWNATMGFSGQYADLLGAPDISNDQTGSFIIRDDYGYIIFRADIDGVGAYDFFYGTEQTSLAAKLNSQDLALANHAANAALHVTSALQTFWNNHVADTAIHVTAAQKTEWEGTTNLFATHKNDTTIHITNNERTTWNQISSHLVEAGLHVTTTLQNEWNTHIADTNLHVTAALKTQWTDAATNFAAHNSNATIHITAAEKNRWDAIIPFSGSYLDLADAPNIANDETSLFAIRDSAGYKAMEVNSDGLYVHSLFVRNASDAIVNAVDLARDLAVAAIEEKKYMTETQVREIVNSIFNTIFVDAEEVAL